MTRVVVVDLGTGNLNSVAKAAEHVAGSNARVSITRSSEQIAQADRVILPGQGAIGSWLKALADVELAAAINHSIANKPVLAICVGMQALFESNDEDGGHQCLGVFEGQIRRFENHRKDQQGLPMKVPQMGWNQLAITRSHPLWNGIANNSWFYFLHSYYAPLAPQSQVVAAAEYGHPYAAAVAKDNVFAIQCHPEKSQATGLKLFANFLSWQP